MKLAKNTAVAVALGSVMVGGSISTQVQADPFGYVEMQSGYQIANNEGKCGEGKCGEKMKKAKEGERGMSESAKEMAKEGKCGEGKCGEEMMKKGKEGKCGEEMKKTGEKKAKEGKCGGAKS
ncbi:hypothetical protein LZP69_05525 [Shewanella sp. AS1]|uniref:HvfA family oxazolone/thioamide-modified RiPP metallophore n=1 Tax=Shewanella sp. AS1 TaxID=2907626 RepID=UPI001F4533C1|nr:hypothetical protein [Shewanella sp. AS1]MCE9678653.1 hypothetical protein [Shewanella sp. AS1]